MSDPKNRQHDERAQLADVGKRRISAIAPVRYLGSAAEHPFADDSARTILQIMFWEAGRNAPEEELVAALGQFRAVEALLWWDQDEVQRARAADAEPLSDESFTAALLWLLYSRTGGDWTLDAFDPPRPGADPMARRINVSLSKSPKTGLVFDHMTALATIARGPITSTPAPFFAHVMRSGIARECSIGLTADGAHYARARALGAELSAAMGAAWRAGELADEGRLCTYEGPRGERVVLRVDRASRALRSIGAPRGESPAASAPEVGDLLAVLCQQTHHTVRRGVVLGALFESESVFGLSIPEQPAEAP